METKTNIFLEYVCPALGVLIANAMFLAPLGDLRSALRIASEGLGDLNPTPWAFMLGNCLGWTAYGILTANWFVFWANYPGLLIACWLNLGAVKLLYSSHHVGETRMSLVRYLSQRNEEGQGQGQGHEHEQEQSKSALSLPMESVEVEVEVEVECSNICENPTASGDCEKEELSSNSKKNAATTTTTTTPTTPTHDWAKIVWDVTSQTTPAETPHERLIMVVIVVWTVVLSVIGFHNHYYYPSASAPYTNGDDDDDNATENDFAQTVVGYVVNLNLVFFYGAPLSKIRIVLKKRQSDFLHLPTMLTNTSNSFFWTSYALAPQINDPFIYVPNGLGVVLGVTQLVLWIAFRKNHPSE